jgi:hypothetical protein
MGIGRYLYRLPPTWVSCEQRGKSVHLKGVPQLPDWALPDGHGHQPVSTPAPNGNGHRKTPSAKKNGGHARSWDAGIVEAVLNANLASNPVEAVKLLNQADLPRDAALEDVLTVIDHQRVS